MKSKALEAFRTQTTFVDFGCRKLAILKRQLEFVLAGSIWLTRGIPDQPLYTEPRPVTSTKPSPNVLPNSDVTSSPLKCLSSTGINEFPPSSESHTYMFQILHVGISFSEGYICEFLSFGGNKIRRQFNLNCTAKSSCFMQCRCCRK